MKNTTKLISILLVLVLVVCACTPTQQETGTTEPAVNEPAKQTEPESSGAEEEPAASNVITDGPFAGMEPMEVPTELGIGLLSGTHASAIVYFIDKLGGFEQMGITPKVTAFANGPVMVEAMNSGAWDFGVYGLGGTLAGSLGYGALVVGAATRDAGSLQFFAPNDSEIVKAGKNYPEYPNLYGTPEVWKGQEVFMPTGTTLHFAFVTALNVMGLTEADVEIVHMEVPNINTALRAGQCSVGGLWTSLPYGDINEKFTPVVKGADLVNLANVLAANPDSYADPVKTEAIKKTIEMYYRVVDWLWDGEKLDEANRQQALDWFVEWNDENGVKSELDAIEALMLDSRHFTLEESYNLITTMSADGRMNLLEEANYLPLDFFIKQERYKPEDGDKLLDGTHNGEYVIEIFEGK